MSEPQTAPFTCVVDANVALKLFLAQPLSEAADALFARLAADAQTRFFVPDFFYAECASALVNYVRLAGYPAEGARQDMSDLRALSLRVAATESLVEAALDIALAERLNGYDACYIALAEQVQAPLITADERRVRALKGKPYAVISLADFAGGQGA